MLKPRQDESEHRQPRIRAEGDQEYTGCPARQRSGLCQSTQYRRNRLAQPVSIRFEIR